MNESTPTSRATMNEESYAHFRRLGTSGLLLPPISLGFWHNFGRERFEGGFEHDVRERPKADFSRQREIVHYAFDHGITHFDLANNYGPPAGSAEEIFGEILRKDLAAHRDEILVTTKAGFRMWPGPYGDGGSRKYLLASLDQSLTRLGLDYVDIFYHHRQDDSTPLEESMGALAHAVKSGKALYAGISNYSPEKTREAATMLRTMGVPLVVNQASYSMLTRTPEESPSGHAEDSLLGVCERLGIGVVAFSPLSQGLLTNRYLTGIPEKSRAAQNVFLGEDVAKDPRYLEKVRALSRVADDRGQSLAQMALAWVLRKRVVTSAIVGASSVQQLRANIAAARTIVRAGESVPATHFSDEEISRIEAILANPVPEN